MINQKKAYLYALMAVLCWSTVATAFKIALKFSDFIQLLFFTSLVSSVVLFFILLIQKKIHLLKSASIKLVLFSLALGGLNPFLYYVILFKAYSVLPAQEAMTLNYTWPIMLIILSIPLLGQKLSLKSSFSVLISFIGIIIISTKGNLSTFVFSNLYGDLLALSSSVIWALFWLFNMKNSMDSVLKLFFNFLSGSFLALFLLLFISDFHIERNAFIPFIYIGIFEMSLTFVFWLTALKYTHSTDKISQLIFLSPFLSLFFITIFIGEKIDVSTIAGLVFIVIGIIMQQLFKPKSI